MPRLPAGTAPELQKAMDEFERDFQRAQHTVFDREPFAAEIPEGGILFAKISGSYYGYTKVKGQRARWALTAV